MGAVDRHHPEAGGAHSSPPTARRSDRGRCRAHPGAFPMNQLHGAMRILLLAATLVSSFFLPGDVAARQTESAQAVSAQAASVEGSLEEWPLTGAERSGWLRATTHDEVLSFLDEIEQLSGNLVVRNLGFSVEGRALPAAFLGAPPAVSPAAAEASGRPTLLVLGSVHGNERSGTEGGLQFIRELTLGPSRGLLESLNVIVVPHMNPDGGATNRRENARGYDLNRDWVVAETPEVAVVLEQLVIPFRPEIFVDAHNGGAFPYHLTYQATLDPTADQDLVGYARGPMYEALREHMRTQGMEMFWYSGPQYDGGDSGWSWRTTEPLPRKQHSYGGLQDMIALLFEVPGRHPLEVGAAATREGLLGLAAFAAKESAEVRNVVGEARRRTVEQGPTSVHLALEPVARPGSEPFQVMVPIPGSGGDTARLVLGADRTLYIPVHSRPAPWGYALEAHLVDVVELLGRHGITVRTLESPFRAQVERYQVQSATWALIPYQNHRMLDLTVELFPDSIVLPAGTHVVPVAQPGGRLIPHLLEPDAIDSVARWNFLDDALGRAGQTAGVLLPIFRLMAPLED